MPLQGAKLIPAICPQCGADLQIPEDLLKVHCMFCGTEFLISENKPDIHYHMGEQVGTIENYINLAISMIFAGDLQRSKSYFFKAKEINLDTANNEIHKKSKRIIRAYLTHAETFDRRLFNTPPIGRKTITGAEVFDVEAGQIITPMIQPSHVSLQTALAWINRFNGPEEERSFMFSDYYVAQGIHNLALAHLWSSYKYHAETQRNHAVENFRSAIQFNPNNGKAIESLKQMNVTCPSCRGDGLCRSCNGTGSCKSCNGSGQCPKCEGSGTRTGLMGKEKTCRTCGGSGSCKVCEGDRTCIDCNGVKTCPQCWGRGV
jgi:tetratricopeptide (TPR) repeat protein